MEDDYFVRVLIILQGDPVNISTSQCYNNKYTNGLISIAMTELLLFFKFVDIEKEAQVEVQEYSLENATN